VSHYVYNIVFITSDHISTYLGPFTVKEKITMNFDRDVTAKSFMDFVNKGAGELSSSGCSATAFVSTPIAKRNGEGNWPDIQLIFLGNGVYTRMASDMAHGFHVKPDVMKKYLESDLGKDSFQIIVSLARPKARGVMKLGGPRYTDELLIDPKYLDNDHDRNVLLEGILNNTAVNLSPPIVPEYS
jgi:choline dehydrogenase-like flavoprotein